MKYIYLDQKSDKTVIAFHGTGGNAQEMVSLAEKYLPGQNVLALEGDVIVNGMSRYAGVNKETGFIDENDMISRLDAINQTIQSVLGQTNPDNLTLLGYSNGANAISALILSGKSIATNHILLRAMDYQHEFEELNLSAKKIDLFAGRHDHLIPVENIENLTEKFKASKAQVTLHLLNSSHRLTMMELQSLNQL